MCIIHMRERESLRICNVFLMAAFKFSSYSDFFLIIIYAEHLLNVRVLSEASRYFINRKLAQFKTFKSFGKYKTKDVF